MIVDRNPHWSARRRAPACDNVLQYARVGGGGTALFICEKGERLSVVAELLVDGLKVDSHIPRDFRRDRWAAVLDWSRHVDDSTAPKPFPLNGRMILNGLVLPHCPIGNSISAA